MSDKNVNRTVRKLLLVAVGMFAFGYALVPLYRVYCDLTGRGSNVAASETAAGMTEVVADRLVTVVFDTNTRDIPWTFKAEHHKTKVHPGELTEAMFMVEKPLRADGNGTRDTQRIAGAGGHLCQQDGLFLLF